MPENLQTELNAIPGAKGLTLRPDGMWIDAPVLDVVGMARVMQQLEARLSTISAVALGNGETRLIYHYAIKKPGREYQHDDHREFHRFINCRNPGCRLDRTRDP